MSAGRCRRVRGDRGSYLLLTAAGLIPVLIITALAVDVAIMHSTRQRAQNTADLAALAAGPILGNPAGRNPQLACEAAFRTVRHNLGPAADGATMPCKQLPTHCTSTSESKVVTAVGLDHHDVTFLYPVPAEHIADDRFDRGTHDGILCERMEVRVGHQVGLFFGPFTGNPEANISATAVVRGTVGFRTRINPALLLLQRYGCGVLQASGQGSVVALAFDEAHPGVIAIDSHGNSTGENACSSNTNAGGYVVFGTPTPSGRPSIEARSTSELPGFLHLHAIRSESLRTAYTVPTGVTPGPTAGPIISRSPVDEQFNPAYRPAISQLRATASSLAAMSPNAARAAGYLVYPEDYPGGDCRPNSDVFIAGEKVFVNCAHFNPRSQGRVIFTGSHIVFSGRLSAGSGNSARFPHARQVVVAGSSNQDGISIAGTLRINDGITAHGMAGPPCTNRSAAQGVPGAVLVVLDGPFASGTSSSVTMCETFVYMASLPSPTQRTSGGSCEVGLPCPLLNAGRGYLRLFGTIDWSAANQSDKKANGDQPYEDLALWTESGTTTDIKGQGATLTTGIYFLPNAHFEFSGQASQNVELNAQFISRSLNMSGQGTLLLKPNPNDAVAIPFADYHLIR